MLFETQEQAAKAINETALGGLAAAETRGVRDWHVYWNWEHLLEQKTINASGCPFKCSLVDQLPNYHTDMCPKTKNIMLRLGCLGIHPGMNSEEIADQAKNLNDAFKKLF